MDRDTAVQRVQDGLGFRTDLAAKIVLRMQEEQRDLERGKTLPRFLILEDQSLSLVANVSTVALPANFLRRTMVESRYTPLVTEFSQTIPWRNIDEATSSWDSEPTQGPQVAVLQAATIKFFPTPNAAYSVTWSYYGKADLLTTNIENLWLANAPEILIGGTGMRIAADTRNKTALELFTAMYTKARSAWFAETVINEVDDEPLILGANA